MKYWLHRITGGENALEFADTLLFKHLYLSIGWSDFSSDVFVSDVKERFCVVIKGLKNVNAMFTLF